MPPENDDLELDFLPEVTEPLDEFGDPIPKADPEPEPTPEPTDEDDKTPASPETPPAAGEDVKSDDPNAEPPTAKKTQTPEENAKFAERRRQEEQRIREKVLSELKEQSPEFKLAQELAQVYGKPVEQIHAEIRENLLQKQAQERGVPVEVLRAQQQATEQIQTLQNQLVQTQFQMWKGRVDAEASTLQKEYPMLTAEDMQAAQDYLLTTIKNPNMPLEEAVQALHGKKIIQALRESSKQEALAELGGRKPSAPAPKGAKSPQTVVLTEEQRAAAKIFNMTDEEYIKYMS